MTLEPPPGPFTQSGFGDLPNHFSDCLKNLVRTCISTKPSDRPTALHIVAACLTRACWNSTHVSPYGVLTGPYFHSRLSRSWNRVVRKVECPDLPLVDEYEFRPSVVADMRLEEFANAEAQGTSIFIEGSSDFKLIHRSNFETSRPVFGES